MSSNDHYQWDIRDPFAGVLTGFGRTAEEAVRGAYADIPADERPVEVRIRRVGSTGEWRWVIVPGGRCEPVQ